jgi:hypothetical protein
MAGTKAEKAKANIQKKFSAPLGEKQKNRFATTTDT